MSTLQKKLLVYLIHLLIALIPFLTGCALLNRFVQAPDRAPVSATMQAPTPPLRSPMAVHPVPPRPRPERLQLPSINLDTPVVELGWSSTQNDNGRVFSEWDVADNAAGWHKNSTLPGAGGNVVMSGHNNILGAVFRELDQLKRGDQAIVWSNGQPFTYQIEEVMIVPEKYATLAQRQANAKWIGIVDEERLTLVSCWPRDDNTHRIIVVAYPVVAGDK